MKSLKIEIPPEIAREMYQFFLRTSAPRIAERKRKEVASSGSK